MACVGVTSAACSSFGDDNTVPLQPDAESGDARPVIPDDGGPPPTEAGKDTSTNQVPPAVLTANWSDLHSIAANDTDVYFVERGPGVIHTIPIMGGTAAEFYAATVRTSPSVVVVVDNVVVWTDYGRSTVSSRNVGGGTVTMITPPDGFPPVAIAAAPSSVPAQVVITTRDGAGAGNVQPLDLMLGVTTATPIATNQANPLDVAVAGSQVFWTDSSGAAVRRAMLASGNSMAPVATGQADCQSIAANGDTVYWANPSSGQVRMAVGPAFNVVPISSNEASPFSLAADDSGVYWLTTDKKLRHFRSNELPIETLAKGFGASYVGGDISGQHIALTKNFIVWTTSDGQVLRLPK